MSTIHDSCPACSAPLGRCRPSPLGVQLRVCGVCGALFGSLYLGDSYAVVKPRFTRENVPPEQVRYFDFLCLGAAGLTRRHGWYDPATGLLVQEG